MSGETKLWMADFRLALWRRRYADAPLTTTIALWACVFAVMIAFQFTTGLQLTPAVALTLAILAVSGALISLAFSPLLSRAAKIQKNRFATVFGFCVIGAAAIAMIEPLATWVTGVSSELTLAERYTPRQLFDTFIFVGWFFVAWAFVVMFIHEKSERAARERDLQEAYALAQRAQLDALRYQVNPHFLFNALNALSTLILKRQLDDAERVVNALSELFRHSLQSSDHTTSTLGGELAVTQSYIDIERVRYGDRLICSFDVEPDLEAVFAPSFIVQPLVENAIKHAVAHSARPVKISVEAKSIDEAQFKISVCDDGPGLKVKGVGGVGLRNIRERLALTYQGRARFSAGPRQSEGFRVDIILPKAAL